MNEYPATLAMKKMLCMDAPIRIVQGGTYAGKTWGIIPININEAITTPIVNYKFTVVNDTYLGSQEVANDIFKHTMQVHGRWNDLFWRQQPYMEYVFARNQARFQFRSFDKPGKAKAAGKRNALFINEANHIKYEIADLLITRSDVVWIDYNPDREFWVHKELLGQPNVQFLRLTYRDNELISEAAIEKLMLRRKKAFHDPDGDIWDPKNIKDEYHSKWWYIYGEGYTGNLEGQIFPNCGRFLVFPSGGRRVIGIDWGYSNDPTAVVDLRKFKDGLYRRQLLYKPLFEKEATTKGMDLIIKTLHMAGVDDTVPIICDNDQTAIDVLRKNNFMAFSAHKPAGSINSGILALQEENILTDEHSQDLQDEEENYIWKIKDGVVTDTPVDSDNHGWDATRYGYDYIMNPKKNHYIAQRKEFKSKRKVSIS